MKTPTFLKSQIVLALIVTLAFSSCGEKPVEEKDEVAVAADPVPQAEVTIEKFWGGSKDTLSSFALNQSIIDNINAAKKKADVAYVRIFKGKVKGKSTNYLCTIGVSAAGDLVTDYYLSKWSDASKTLGPCPKNCDGNGIPKPTPSSTSSTQED